MSRDGWQRVPLGAMGFQLTAQCPNIKAFQKDAGDGHLSVLVGIEPDHPGGPKWHLSISHRTNDHPPRPGRYPTWDEITSARYLFVPNKVTMVMFLPPREEYVNVHETCFHLWEVAPEREHLGIPVWA